MCRCGYHVPIGAARIIIPDVSVDRNEPTSLINNLTGVPGNNHFELRRETQFHPTHLMIKRKGEATDPSLQDTICLIRTATTRIVCCSILLRLHCYFKVSILLGEAYQAKTVRAIW